MLCLRGQKSMVIMCKEAGAFKPPQLPYFTFHLQLAATHSGATSVPLAQQWALTAAGFTRA